MPCRKLKTLFVLVKSGLRKRFPFRHRLAGSVTNVDSKRHTVFYASIEHTRRTTQKLTYDRKAKLYIIKKYSGSAFLFV